jgi:hypothetical protein
MVFLVLLKQIKCIKILEAKWKEKKWLDSPVQIYEEKDKIISQIYHTVSHMFLQLAPIMNFSRIKHSCVSCGNCEIPKKINTIKRYQFFNLLIFP